MSRALGQGAGGSFYFHAELTLHGTRPCTLTGFPGLDVLTSRGTEHAQRADGPQQRAPTVLLAPGTVGYVNGSWVESPHTGQDCPGVGAVVITPPDLHESTRLRIVQPGGLVGGGQVCQHSVVTWVTARPTS